MARTRHSDEDILKLLREIELKLTAGDDVASACRSVGISDATYYNWRKRFGGMGRSPLSEMKSLEKEDATSARRTCRVIGLTRSSLQYRPVPRDDDALRLALIRLAKQYGRYGYRKITELLHVEGWRVNHKKVERLLRED